MSPTEVAPTLDRRLSAVRDTLRDRLLTTHARLRARLESLQATGRTHLVAVVDRARQPGDADTSTTHSPEPADTPTPPPSARSSSDSGPVTLSNTGSDHGTAGDMGDSSFPVLSEEPDRDINDVLFERGLTREEYVLEILEGHDGRLRQQRIKEYTGWSAASVSRLLGRMEDADRITRFRIGNEKVVCLPDADPRQNVLETEIALTP